VLKVLRKPIESASTFSSITHFCAPLALQLAQVNACHFLPGGNSLATASDDATVRVFDVRCRGELRCLSDDAVSRGASSLAASSSGRILFAGYDDSYLRAFDLFGLLPQGSGGGSGNLASSGLFGCSSRHRQCNRPNERREAGGAAEALHQGFMFTGSEPARPRAITGGSGDGGGGGGGGCAWVLEGHKSRVSCCAVSRSGGALATGSWDSDLRIWA